MPDAHTSDQLVRNVMSASPVTIGPDATVRDVARLLADADIGAVPVVSDGKLAGIVTDRDLVVRVLAAGMGPDTTDGRDRVGRHLLRRHPTRRWPRPRSCWVRRRCAACRWWTARAASSASSRRPTWRGTPPTR